MYQGKSKNNLINEYSVDNEYLTCKKCKQTRTPCKEEVSKINPNRYYKMCQKCRAIQNNYNINYKKKNNNLA